MAGVKDFEKTAIRLLTAGVLAPDVLDIVLAKPQSGEYEYTGCGYYLTIYHPAFPVERIACYKPLVLGQSRGVEAGFIVYFEDHRLTLECHSYAVAVPEDYREQDVRVTAT